jgi:hypothetical protein
LQRLRTASEEAVQFNFWLESVKVDLNLATTDDKRSPGFWFHFKSTADITLAYRVMGGFVRFGTITSEISPERDTHQNLLAAGSPEDYGWDPMRSVTKDDMKDVELHLVVHYGRPTGGPWFAMDCLVQPVPCASFDDGWPSNWVLFKKRETTHKPVG